MQNCGHTSLQPFCIYVGCSLLAKYLSEVWIWEHPKAYDCSSHRIDQLEGVNILSSFDKKVNVLGSCFLTFVILRKVFEISPDKSETFLEKIQNISDESRNFSPKKW